MTIASTVAHAIRTRQPWIKHIEKVKNRTSLAADAQRSRDSTI